MKILFVTNVPAPYRVDFFNEFAKFCDLTVCYERFTSQERDLNWKNDKERSFKEIFCTAKNMSTDKSIGFDLIRRIKKEKFDHLIISGYSSPSVMLLITYCRIFRIPYYIETDGGFAKKDKLPLRILKRFLIRKATGIFTTCNELERYFKEIGYNGNIYKYPLSSFFQEDIFSAPAADQEKNLFRSELCITEARIVLTVGRFTYKNGYGKGYDTVLRTAKAMNDKSIGWYIVGGAPTDEFIRMKEDFGLDNVHYIDFMKPEILKKYYRAADIFVLMTIGDVWGLVINEAMACGLPVITTNKCIAGLEMVDENKNGHIIPVGDDKALVCKINSIINDDVTRARFSSASIEKASYFTIENMVEKHIEVLKAVTNKEI